MKYFLFVFLFLFFCSCKKIEDGTIDKMYYQPPHYYYWNQVIMVGKVPITVVHKEWEPDTTFYIHFIKEVNGKNREREIVVSGIDFQQYNIGDKIELKD